MSVRSEEPVLTRDMLRAGGIERMIADSVPQLRMLTDEERAASLAAVLTQRREPGRGAWVFAYGSLIWNPAIHYVERRFARVHGWHRRFCLSTIAGRGSPDLPGLVLGLDRGGACTGASFRIAEECLDEELPILWRREMLSGSYRPRWVTVRDAAGAPFGEAIAFTIRQGGAYYAGELAEDEIVRRLAKARGALGSSAEYLFQTRDGLRSLGIVDRRIERLAEQVAQLLPSRQPAHDDLAPL
jgi:cation transport protein ChaC